MRTLNKNLFIRFLVVHINFCLFFTAEFTNSLIANNNEILRILYCKHLLNAYIFRIPEILVRKSFSTQKYTFEIHFC